MGHGWLVGALNSIILCSIGIDHCTLAFGVPMPLQQPMHHKRRSQQEHRDHDVIPDHVASFHTERTISITLAVVMRPQKLS